MLEPRIPVPTGGRILHPNRRSRSLLFAMLSAAMALILMLVVPSSVIRAQSAGPSANVSVFAAGLDEPRGLTFGSDGSLYVADAGHGGSYVATDLPLTSFG